MRETARLDNDVYVKHGDSGNIVLYTRGAPWVSQDEIILTPRAWGKLLFFIAEHGKHAQYAKMRNVRAGSAVGKSE